MSKLIIAQIVVKKHLVFFIYISDYNGAYSYIVAFVMTPKTLHTRFDDRVPMRHRFETNNDFASRMIGKTIRLGRMRMMPDNSEFKNYFRVRNGSICRAAFQKLRLIDESLPDRDIMNYIHRESMVPMMIQMARYSNYEKYLLKLVERFHGRTRSLNQLAHTPPKSKLEMLETGKMWYKLYIRGRYRTGCCIQCYHWHNVNRVVEDTVDIPEWVTEDRMNNYGNVFDWQKSYFCRMLNVHPNVNISGSVKIV
jgi:hypothetical protein